jgi:hypothetical protein
MFTKGSGTMRIVLCATMSGLALMMTPIAYAQSTGASPVAPQQLKNNAGRGLPVAGNDMFVAEKSDTDVVYISVVCFESCARQLDATKRPIHEGSSFRSRSGRFG